MIHFPPEYIKTDYPGYLWNVKEQKLYSLKVNGVLKPLTFQRGGVWIPKLGSKTIPGYRISHNGIKKTITLNYLRSLPFPKQMELY